MIKRIFVLGLIVGITSCVPQEKVEKKDRIILAEKNDAATLNPVSASDELSIYLSMQIFQSLLGLDFEGNDLVGILAQNRPRVETKNGNQWITYTLREGITFTDGSPLTVNDVIFSLKTNVCPLVNNIGGRNYYGAIIDSVKLDAENPLKFTFICKEINTRNEIVSGDFSILQESKYDSLYLLRNFSYEELMATDNLEGNDSIQRFAEYFNDPKRAFNPANINGSGAYTLKEWIKGQRIVIEKKSNWWGDELKDENIFFRANAPILQYEIIPDENTALSALKSSEVDFIRTLGPKDFVDMKNSDTIPGITFGSQETYSYTYLCYNLNNPILADLAIRKAISHAVPRMQIIETVFYEQATLTNAPFSSIRTELINDTITGYEYNLDRSLALINGSSWSDSNEDGIADNTVNGIPTDLSLRYLYNSESKERKAVGLILQNELKKIGVELKVEGVEWSTYIQRLRAREFDIFYGGKRGIPIAPDFSSTFHSSGANTGRNYANYQNLEIDSLIEQIAVELDELKRKELVNRFQEIIYRDVPYLYLFTPKKHIAFSKELKNANIYSLRPNFWAPELSW